MMINSTDFKLTINGKEVKSKPFKYVGENLTGTYFGMEYYQRIGNSYYFRSKAGIELIVETDEDLHKHIKYGQFIDLAIN